MIDMLLEAILYIVKGTLWIVAVGAVSIAAKPVIELVLSQLEKRNR